MSRGATIIVHAVRDGTLSRLHPTEQAIYTALAVVCGDGPKTLNPSSIAMLAGVSERNVRTRLNNLIRSKRVLFSPLRSFVKAGQRNKFVGIYTMPDPSTRQTLPTSTPAA
jgi:hypothetical protein